MKKSDQEAFREALEKVGRMNGLMKRLLSATSSLRTALSEKSVDGSARAMDIREEVLENAARLREELFEILDSSWKGVALPEKIVAVLEENRRTLTLVHEMEKECMTLASGYRDEIKDRLGQVRAVRKMKVYQEGGGKKRAGPPKLFKKKV